MPRNSTPRVNAIIGENLRRLRKRLKLTQGELAELVDVTTQQISKYEKGTDQVSTPRLARLASALKVQVTELTQGLAQALAVPAGFAEAAQAPYGAPTAEDGRRLLLAVYDQLDEPSKGVARKQIQALLDLQDRPGRRSA